MRKIELMALYFLILGSTTFALDMVIGGGGLFGYTFEQYEIYDEDEYLYRNDNNAMIFGGFAFFGLSRYMEASIAVYRGINDAIYKYPDGTEEPYEYPGYQVGISLYFKYPITLGSRLVLFPTVGMDVQNNNGGLDLWFRGGLGMDIFFTEKLFLRGQGFYGYDFLMIYKGDLNESQKALPTHGPLFKLGLGWMY